MPVEVGGLAEHGDETVDARELDDGVNRAVVHARDEGAERKADADLGTQTLPPLHLVPPQPRVAQIVGAQRVVERLGRNLAGDEAVVNPTAGRRLDEACGVADGEQP